MRRTSLHPFIILVGIFTVLIVSSGSVAEDEGGLLTLTFFDLGQGDSCLLQVHNKTMLIDAGTDDAGPVISDLLKKRNISSLDVMVATHPHNDHIGGMPAILNQIKTGILIGSGDTPTTPSDEILLKTIKKRHIPYKTVHEGDTIDLDPGIRIDVLSPEDTKSDDINENSIVLKITSGKRLFLFMGDAGFYTEER